MAGHGAKIRESRLQRLFGIYRHVRCGSAVFQKGPDDPENLQQIKQLLSLSRLKKRRHTFLCGDTGALAIGAVVAHKLGQISESQAFIKKYEQKKLQLSCNNCR